jgi:hypothetical protein
MDFTDFADEEKQGYGDTRILTQRTQSEEGRAGGQGGQGAKRFGWLIKLRQERHVYSNELP